MKKNLMSVLILALLIVNIVLTVITMVSVTSTNKKTASVVNSIATVLNLELNTSGENYAEYISSMIKRTDIPVKAVLGKSVVSVMDFAGLQVGDVIRLDSKIDDEMEVYVGNIKKFTALPGTSKDNYAVRITSVVREEE